MKKSIVLGVLIFFVGCSKIEHLSKNSKVSLVKAVKQPIPKPNSRAIFSDAHVKHGNIRMLIESLDAFPWEKKVLHLVYRHEGKMIWDLNQIGDFRKILEDNPYLSMCGDRRYWSYLEETKESVKHDVLYSLLLLRYLNNLSSGCREWVVSDGRILNENRRQNIKAEYLLSLLASGALVKKLFIPYFPKNREFFVALQHYKALEKLVENHNDLKRERLYIEAYKTLNIYPTYD